MKKFLPLFSLLLFSLFSSQLNAQNCDKAVVTFEPAVFSGSDLVKLTVNLAQCTPPAGKDMYLWLWTPSPASVLNGDWNNSNEALKMTKNTDGSFSFTFGPTLAQFYGMQASAMNQINFLLKTKDGTWQTIDLKRDVVQATLSVKFILPTEKPKLVELNESFAVEIAGYLSTGLELFIDNESVAKGSEASLTYTATAAAKGKHWLKAVATDGTNFAKDSLYFYTLGTNPVAELPTGLKNGITYNSATSVSLVLHAPNKQFVFAIGDFNNWELSDEFLMNKTPDGQKYWITLNNLESGKEYGFQYFVDGKIRIADPYSEKVLDPWNDGYIAATNYPNLKAYPKDKTSEIVGVFQPGKPAYNWQVTNFSAPLKTDLVIYELHVRDFVKEWSIKAVLDTINYLKKLGVNAIELMPINEFEGNNSWGYNPSFYFAADKQYGTEFDYKKFIDECHKAGIAVIIDMVLNHSFGQSPFVRLYMNNYVPTAENPWFNTSCPHQPWCWGADFNHSSPLVKELIDRVNSYWLTEYKVDGFRFDFTKGFTNTVSDGWAKDDSRIANLKRMADEIWKVNSKAYVILEHLTDNSEEKILAEYGMMLWGNMNGKYNEATMGWNESGKSDVSGVYYKNRNWTVPHLIGYMESHDEERLMYKNIQYGNTYGTYSIKNPPTALQRVELAANFFLTVPGPKMIWQFGELGYDFSINTCNNAQLTVSDACRVDVKPIRWTYLYNPDRLHLYKVYAALIKLKKEHEVFRTGDVSLNVATAMKQIVLKSSGLNVVVLGNFDVKEGKMYANFPKTGTWYDYYTGKTLTVTTATSATEITMQPGEYRLYTDVSIGIADLATAISPDNSRYIAELKLFPNPARHEITVQSDEIIKSIQIYDINGKIMHRSVENTDLSVMQVSQLPIGYYFVKIETQSGKIAVKEFIRASE